MYCNLHIFYSQKDEIEIPLYERTGDSEILIKRDQLNVTCFTISLFTAQHISDVNTSILRSFRPIWWVIAWVVWFWLDVCWCCVVVVRYPYAGWSSLHTDTAPPQPNHNVTPTRIEREQYNPWNNHQISRKLLRMDVLTSETCWALNNEIIKQVTSSWSLFIQLWRWCTVQ